MNIHKPVNFDKAAYEHSDPVKYAIVDFLNKKGLATICVEDKWSADIKVFKIPKEETPTYCVEVEHRTVWKSNQETFPFNSISVPARKFRHKKQATYFCVVREDSKKCYMIDSMVLDDSMLICKDTTRSKKEYFYHVPIKLCNLVNLSD